MKKKNLAKGKFKAGVLRIFAAFVLTVAGFVVFSQIGENFEITEKAEASTAAVNSPFIQSERLTANDGAVQDNFGYTVAVDGDTAIVGMPLDDISGANDRGSAYVFKLVNNVWTFQTKLTASDGAAGDNFGFSVAISGNMIIVGAPGDSTGSAVNAGSVYFFAKNGATWQQQQKLLSLFIDEGNNGFGTKVGIQRNVAAVYSSFIGPFATSLQIERPMKNSNGVWVTNASGGSNSTGHASFAFNQGILFYGNPFFDTEKQMMSGFIGSFGSHSFISPEISAGNKFGFDLFIEENVRLIVGEPGNGNQLGAAYVYNSINQPNNPVLQQKLTSTPRVQNSGFGKTVGGSGDLAVVGAPGESAVYTFGQFGSVWTQNKRITASDSTPNNKFAETVVAKGNQTIVGASGDNNNAGAVYVFENIPSETANAAQYDFDGDGRSDLSVFRPSNGGWYINASTAGFYGLGWGFSTDLLAPANFDGDGKTDVAVFRPSDGGWYRLNSSTNTFTGVTFGQSGDLPRPADYDGDGKADIAVFRNGDWYYLKSSSGAFIGQTFGFGTDKPIPSALN